MKEYKLINKDYEDLSKALNRLSKEGWQLVKFDVIQPSSINLIASYAALLEREEESEK